MVASLYRRATPDCKAAALALLLAACIPAPDYTKPIPPAALEGPARVIDGDSLKLAGTSIRIYGIDAPERAQQCTIAGEPYPCGRAAERALRALAGAWVACSPSGGRTYGRIVAMCSSGGVDLGATMVASGWALAYRRYSSAYVALEAEARAARRGLWAGEFVEPWIWRRRKK